MTFGEDVDRGGVHVGRGEVGEGAAGLEADQVPEHLVRRQAVPPGQRHQFGADLVPARGEARPGARLHEHPVEGERKERRIVEPAGRLLGLPRRQRSARGADAAGLHRDRGQQPAAGRLVRGVGGECGQGALGRGDDAPGLFRVVPRVQIAGTS